MTSPWITDDIVRVLVIWTETPEFPQLLTIRATREVALQLRSFHNEYINSVYTPEPLQQEMLDFFYQGNGVFKFEANKIGKPLKGADFDVIVMCGFML